VVLLLDVLPAKVVYTLIGNDRHGRRLFLFQAHNLGDRIQDIDLQLLDVKTVSEVLSTVITCTSQLLWYIS